MLSHELTMELIAKAQQGDSESKSMLLEHNLPLVKSLVKRYIGKHTEYDDLIQIASIGLLKAVDNFSDEYNVRFSTYAVPLILGEVKRFMRDDGYIKVSRATKSLASKINKYIEEYRGANSADPPLEVIAQKYDITVPDVVFAIDSARMPLSIFEQTDTDSKSLSLADRLSDDSHNIMQRDLLIKDMMSQLEDREQQLLQLRYYQDMTQSEIAKILNITQVQVSRMEYKIIQKLRGAFSD